MIITDALQVQIAKETTWGTAVSPMTAKLMDVTDFTLKPIVESTRHKTRRGSFAPAYKSNITKIAAEGSFESLASFEDLPYWIESVFGIATPSGSGTYTRDYAAPLTSAPTSPRIFSVVYGTGSDIYRGIGIQVAKLTISGERNAPLMVKGDLIGKEVDSSGALAALSDRTTEAILFPSTALYIDASGGTIGTTAIADLWSSFELSIDTGRAVRHYNSLKPSRIKEAVFDIELKLTLEFDSTSKAFVDAIVAGSTVFEKQVRIKATSGTKVAQFDFAGIAEAAPEIWTDDDGAGSVELTLKAQYNAALANYFKAQCVNAVATLA